MGSQISVPDIVFVGLDNAGKSTIIKQVLGEVSIASTAPTMGYDRFAYFHPIHSGCQTKMFKFNLVDLGGHERIRQIWQHYYGTALGVVFVFDASDERRLDESRAALSQVLEANGDKYVLICGNKQDLSATVTTQQQFEAKFRMKLPPNIQFKATVGTEANEQLSEGMQWMFNGLATLDQRQFERVREAEEETRKKRRFAGLTEEEKLEKLKQLKAENDLYEAQKKQQRTGQNESLVPEPSATIQPDTD